MWNSTPANTIHLDSGTSASWINAGNVGIGTTAPGTNVGIAGGVGIGTTDSFANAAIAANNLAVQGSVGIGTTSPSQLLQISNTVTNGDVFTQLTANR
jgi:hypothetical protein